MSCAGGRSEHYPRAAEFVEKMLKDAKAADLRVEQPIKFDVIFNLKTTSRSSKTADSGVRLA